MFKKIKLLIRNILIRSQKYTGTDNVYIATHGSYLTLGNIVSTLTSFFLAMAFARLLPKTVYGQYDYILSIMTVIGIAALPGMETAIVQAVARGMEGSFKAAMKKRFKYALAGSVACLLMGAYFLFFGHNVTFSISFLIAAMFFPFMEPFASYLSYLGGKKLFGVQVKYSTLTQIISSICTIIALFSTKNLIILVLVYFASNTILRIYFLLRTLRKYVPNTNCDPGCINFGKHLTVIEIVETISGQLVNILLFNLLGATQLAIYAFVTLPTKQALYFLKSIRQIILPKLAARTTEEIRKTLLKKVMKSFLFIVPMIVIYIIAAPYIYRIFFPQYMESVPYSQLYILTLIAFPLTILATTFNAKMMKKQIYQISILTNVTKIILLLIMIPFYGIMGAIIAQILGQLFYMLLVFWFFKKSDYRNF
jgi:O-antigen/teichoic acid export membrane protein